MIRKRDEGHGPSKIPAFDNSQPLPGHLVNKRQVAAICGVSQRTVDDWRLTRFSLPKVLAALARYEVKEVGAAS